jgi:hypothetical protein
VAAWVAVERRHCTSARCGHCSACASDQMLRRIIPTAERTVTRGGDKAIDKGDAIREQALCGEPSMQLEYGSIIVAISSYLGARQS